MQAINHFRLYYLRGRSSLHRKVQFLNKHSWDEIKNVLASWYGAIIDPATGYVYSVLY